MFFSIYIDPAKKKLAGITNKHFVPFSSAVATKLFNIIDLLRYYVCEDAESESPEETGSDCFKNNYKFWRRIEIGSFKIRIPQKELQKNVYV